MDTFSSIKYAVIQIIRKLANCNLFGIFKNSLEKFWHSRNCDLCDYKADLTWIQGHNFLRWETKLHGLSDFRANAWKD